MGGEAGTVVFPCPMCGETIYVNPEILSIYFVYEPDEDSYIELRWKRNIVYHIHKDEK